MIDFDLEIRNMQPINIRNIENPFSIDDRIRKSIILYNKSIAEIKSNDFDVAINDLKKALSYNQGFSDAIKLLGLCYVKKKNFRKAEKTFKKLGDYGIYSELAREYITALIIERNVAKTMDVIRSANSNSKKKHSFLTKLVSKRAITSFSILLIVIAGLALMYFTSPSLQAISEKVKGKDQTSDAKEVVDKFSVQKEIADEGMVISVEDYKNLEQELNNARSELDSYREKYDVLIMLSEVEKSLKDGNYEGAASGLLTIRDMSFDDEAKARFDRLWTDLRGNGIWTIYNQGSKLHKARKYQEALPKLLIASEFVPSAELMPWVLYQIGECYKETNDNTKALAFLQKVKDDYPESKYASYSERMISQVGNMN